MNNTKVRGMVPRRAVAALGTALLMTVAAGGSVVAQAAGAPDHLPRDVAAHQVRSALLTEEQREQEATAREILDRPRMKRSIKWLQRVYRSTPRGQLVTGRERADDAAAATAGAATLMALGADPYRPVLTWATTAAHSYQGLSMPNSGYGIENPDNVYRQTLLTGDSAYVIRGKASRHRPIEQHFELRDAMPGTTVLTPEAGKTLGAISSHEIHFKDDGSFKLTLDAQPANGRVNHIQIPAGTTSWLVVRDLLNNWNTERPIELKIKRVAGPKAPKAPSIKKLTRTAAQILRKIGPFWMSYFESYLYRAPGNKLTPVIGRPGGRGLFAYGWFDLTGRKALVITVDPKTARSFGIQVTDPWGLAYEYIDQSSSRNLRQATPNADGTYTFVVAAKDPGVRNWLDTDGFKAGLVSLRWQVLSGPAPDQQSAVRQVQLVDVANLASALPAGTPHFGKKDRAKELERRANRYWKRLRD